MADKKYSYIRRTFTYNGKRYEVTGHTKKEAQSKMDALKLELSQTGGTKLDHRTTVDEWFNEWIQTYKEPTSSAMHVYHMRLNYKNHISPEIGHLRLVDVKTVHIQKAVNKIQGCSNAWISAVMSMVWGMFRSACQCRMIIFNPADGVVRPTGVDHERRPITDKERQSILDAASGNLAIVIRIMLWAGLRPGEVCALQWKDIDFSRNEIHIYKSVKANTKTIGGPKTKSGIRDVPMQDALASYLKSIAGDPFDYVVQPDRGSFPPLRTASLTISFNRFREKIGLSDDVTLYSLRHTFCTDMEAAGIPINIASKLIGHSDIGTTAAIYTHTYSDILHANIAKFNVGKSVENVE